MVIYSKITSSSTISEINLVDKGSIAIFKEINESGVISCEKFAFTHLL